MHVGAGLGEVYAGAAGAAEESREELDGLAHLVERLDYNGFACGSAADDLTARLRAPPPGDLFGL